VLTSIGMGWGRQNWQNPGVASYATASINNLAEKVCNVLLVIIQLQRQSFLAFAAAHLLKITSKMI